MTSKYKLLLATSVLALGLASGNAQAFDTVSWTWNGTFTTDVTSETTIIDPMFATTGLTQVETLQINVGNSYAFANADYTSVNLPYYYGSAGNLSNLGTVTVVAAAIGNSQSITSNFATNFHDGQVNFGDFNAGAITQSCDTCTVGTDSFLGTDTGNQMVNAVNAAAMAAALGYINKNYNVAIASSNYGKNVSVDVTAQSIGNAHSVDVETLAQPMAGMGMDGSQTASDNVVIGDLSQFNFGNNLAIASAKGNSTYNLSLGSTPAPVVKVTAIAVGNSSSITNIVKP